MQKPFISFFILVLWLGTFPQTALAKKNLSALKVNRAPVIDGEDTDPVWKRAKKVVTRDRIANIDITAKAVYTDKEIFFLISFPDEDESRSHKPWVWDKSRELYTQGADREDIFVIKWSMETEPVDLSLSSDDLYRADIWYWKACRTDPVGYADDKIQHMTAEHAKNSTELRSKSKEKRYLLRKGDSGEAAYRSEMLYKFEGYSLRRFRNGIPTGSRGDVRAKGVWKDGKWTVEFARALQTGNDDDVHFDANKTYQFGLSRYEIAGRRPDPAISQPLYGFGDISEELLLHFMK